MSFPPPPRPPLWPSRSRTASASVPPCRAKSSSSATMTASASTASGRQANGPASPPQGLSVHGPPGHAHRGLFLSAAQSVALSFLEEPEPVVTRRATLSLSFSCLGSGGGWRRRLSELTGAALSWLAVPSSVRLISLSVQRSLG